MDKIDGAYQIIFVNDGSVFFDLKYLEANMDSNIVKIINLPVKLGQTKALARGLEGAVGNVVISMDGDLQDNPEYIQYFIDKLSQGFDVVCGRRVNRKDAKNKILLSKIGNFVQNLIFHTGLHDISCTYRAYKKECVRSLKLIRNGYHRYIPFLLIREGYKVTEINIEQRERVYGRSKYSCWKVVDAVFTFLYIIFDIVRKRI